MSRHSRQREYAAEIPNLDTITKMAAQTSLRDGADRRGAQPAHGACRHAR
jgi:hypothetical protein